MNKYLYSTIPLYKNAKRPGTSFRELMVYQTRSVMDLINSKAVEEMNNLLHRSDYQWVSPVWGLSVISCMISPEGGEQ